MVAVVVDRYRRFFRVGGQGDNSDADGEEDDSCPALATKGSAEEENSKDCRGKDLGLVSYSAPALPRLGLRRTFSWYKTWKCTGSRLPRATYCSVFSKV